MSDRIFASLLLLFPSRLRSEHGAEMLQLYRDRMREETGLARRVRLYIDLLSDLMIGIPQAYRNAFTSAGEGELLPNTRGIPSFSVFQKEPLKPSSIAAAATIGLVMIAVFAFLMTHPIGYRDFTSVRGPISPIQSVIEKVNQPTIPDSGTSSGGDQSAVPSSGSGTPAAATAPRTAAGAARLQNADSQPAPTPTLAMPQQPTIDASRIPMQVPATPVAPQTEAANHRRLPNSASSSQSLPKGATTSAASAIQPRSTTVGIASSGNLDPAERNRVIQSVADNLVAHYYDRGRAQQASADLLSLEKHGYYNEIIDGQSLASRLTFELQRSTNDRHLRVEFSRNVLPEAPSLPSASAPASHRAALQQENCTFEKVEVLPGNLGYIKLNSFPDRSTCGATAESAIARLCRSRAIIFDLRDNTGGYPEMVATMAAPLFDHPVRWYNPREGDGSHWLSPAGESKLAHKPVYILTSALTLSAAEQFTYNLKMLGRATVVGDTTGGSAHVGIFHRIDDHFGIGIPETRIVNPYGVPDWEGTGIEPDVRVVPSNALAVAEKLARKQLRK